MKNRSRPIQILFCVNEKEKALLDKKVKNAGFTNTGAFIRKMLLSGYVLKIDFEPINKLVFLTSFLSNKLNQLAKKANSYEAITIEDIDEIRRAVKTLHDTNMLLLTG